MLARGISPWYARAQPNSEALKGRHCRPSGASISNLNPNPWGLRPQAKNFRPYRGWDFSADIGRTGQPASDSHRNVGKEFEKLVAQFDAIRLGPELQRHLPGLVCQFVAWA